MGELTRRELLVKGNGRDSSSRRRVHAARTGVNAAARHGARRNNDGLESRPRVADRPISMRQRPLHHFYRHDRAAGESTKSADVRCAERRDHRRVLRRLV